MADYYYWVTDSGAYIGDGNGVRIVFAIPEPPPPPSPELLRVLRIRMLVGDPAAPFIALSPEPPVTQIEGAAYTSGNGVYYVYHAATGWTPVKTILADEFLAMLTQGNEYSGAQLAIQKLLTTLNPADYVQSFTAGGQSTSFASFADCLNWYKERQKYIAGIAQKFGAGVKAYRRPAPVGELYD